MKTEKKYAISNGHKLFVAKIYLLGHLLSVMDMDYLKKKCTVCGGKKKTDVM